MDTLLSQTKYLAKKYGLRPQRRSGQNFLISEDIVNRIIQSAHLSQDDRVLEIGAGFGTLTQKIAEKVKKVWAVELEKRFYLPLKKLSSGYSTIKVIKEDILKLDIAHLVGTGTYKIVANLPYNITSLVLRNFLEKEPKPSLIILLLQKEVAERIVSLPGDLNLLAISVQFYGKPEIIQIVERKNFWPEPQMDSALIKIEKIKSNLEIEEELKRKKLKINAEEFFQVARAGFSAKRKQIHNNLANSFHTNSEKIKKILRKIQLDYQIRSQNLSLEDWKRLANVLKQEKII